jgi:tRNA pseudouridine(55) synthase
MSNLDNHIKHTQNDIFVAYKKEGETPLECLGRLKDEGFLPYSDKFTYAGRLDPMAEGLMIYLRGEAIKSKDEFLGLSKEYEVEILLGVSTDTGDILGLVNQAVLGDVVFDLKNVQNICESFVGEMEVPYPWFSSKTFEGKPLYEWAREFADEDSSDDVGERGQEVFLRPMTKLSIQKIDFLDLSLMSVDDLQNNIVRRIAKVKGDFRQENILNEWNSKVFAKNKSKKIKEEIEYPIIKIRVRCGSGSYMRTLAELIGDKLKVPALAYSIKRLGVGEYRV